MQNKLLEGRFWGPPLDFSVPGMVFLVFVARTNGFQVGLPYFLPQSPADMKPNISADVTWKMGPKDSPQYDLVYISIYIDIILVGGFNHLEEYERQWEGLSLILWKIKND
jgi:hypothetical protein